MFTIYNVSNAAVFCGFVAVLFWIAGGIDYPFLWATLGIQAALAIIGIKVLDVDLIRERLEPGGKDEDAVGRGILVILCFVHYGIAAWDVGRAHVSNHVPFAVQAAALVPVALGWAGMLWAMAVNRYFSTAVRLQPDRGQTVISEGPYRCVRHPGYAFSAIAFLAQGLALGSYLSMVPAVLIVLYMGYRTMLEERLLGDELPGYEEYAQKVRYQWVPFIW